MEIFCRKSREKNRSEDAYALLSSAAKAIYGIDSPKVEKTPWGKPFFPACPDIFFSISHSGGYLLCALSDSPVGADIQIKKNISSVLPERVCRPEELRVFNFFDLWSLKESYIKLIGKKELDYRDMVFSLNGSRIVCSDRRVYCRLYSGVPDCSCAVLSFSDEFPSEIRFL